MERLLDIPRITALAFNLFTILYCFPKRRTGIATYASLLATLAAVSAVWSAARSTGLPILVLPPGLLFFVPIAFILDAPLYQKTFVFFSHFFVSISVPLASSWIAEASFAWGSDGYYIFCAALSELLFGACFALAIARGREFYRRLFSSGTPRMWGFCSLLPALCWLIQSKLYLSPRVTPNPLPGVGVAFYVMPLVFMFLSLSLLCAAIIKTHEGILATRDLELSRSILKSGKEYYEKLASLSERMRIMRHDYRHHLAAISRMLDDPESAAKYLTSMERQYDELAEPGFCSRKAVNAFLAAFAERCAAEGVDFRPSLRLPPEDEADLEDYELCIVLANLLENAFEACAGLDQGQRRVELGANYQGRQLIIRVQNSFDGVVDLSGSTPSSRKPGGGAGIKSIEAVAERHGGRYLCEWTEDLFTATVVMIFKS